MASYFDNAQTVREGSDASYKTEYALAATVIAAIAVSVAANSYSCTVSVSGGTAQDVQNIMRWLIKQNFTATLAGSTLSISW